MSNMDFHNVNHPTDRNLRRLLLYINLRQLFSFINIQFVAQVILYLNFYLHKGEVFCLYYEVASPMA